jgi:hypothetical protein
MKKHSLAVAAVVAALGVGTTAFAADHLDGTTTTGGALADPSVDITDVFAWMTSDTTATSGSVNLVMDVFPGATTTSLFSTTAKYVFHTASKASYSATTAVKRDVICTFSGTTAPQTVSCWVTDPTNANDVKDYISGDATSPTTALVSMDTNIKAFTGLRNDPFFFNLAGFKNATSTVAAAIANYTANPAANHSFIAGFDTSATTCPILTNTARTAVTSILAKDCTGVGTPDDFFRAPETGINTTCVTKPTYVTTQTTNEGTTGNVLAIVLQLNKTLLTSGGPILGVWAATTK